MTTESLKASGLLSLLEVKDAKDKGEKVLKCCVCEWKKKHLYNWNYYC